jgi:hypothetical protein
MTYPAIESSIGLSLVASLFVCGGCYEVTSLGKCDPGATLVGPGQGGLAPIQPSSGFLFANGPVWSLAGQLETSESSPIAASFLPALTVCGESTGRPSVEDELGALALSRLPSGCTLGNVLERVDVAPLFASGSRSDSFCVASATAAFQVTDDTAQRVELGDRLPIVGVTTAGPDECVFLHPNAYSVAGRLVQVGPRDSLQPTDVGGFTASETLMDGLPWHRLDANSQSYVVQRRELAYEVQVPNGSKFVAGLSRPTLLAVENGKLLVVRLPAMPIPGSLAEVSRLSLPSYSFTSVEASYGEGERIYALVEFQQAADVNLSSVDASRSMAWTEVDLGSSPSPSASVRMHLRFRSTVTQTSWFRDQGEIRLLLVADGRLGVAELTRGFCWVEHAGSDVQVAAGNRAGRVLVSRRDEFSSAYQVYETIDYPAERRDLD